MLIEGGKVSLWLGGGLSGENAWDQSEMYASDRLARPAKALSFSLSYWFTSLGSSTLSVLGMHLLAVGPCHCFQAHER